MMSSVQWLMKTIRISKHAGSCYLRGKQLTPSMRRFFQHCSVPRYGGQSKTVSLQVKSRMEHHRSHHSSVNWQVCSAVQRVNTGSATSLPETPIKQKNDVTNVLIDVEVDLKQFPDIPKSLSEWEIFQAQYLEKCPKCDKIFNFKVLETLHSQGKVELAISFKDFIESKNQSNIVTDAQFMLICADRQPEISLKEYAKLKNSYDLKYVNSTLGRLLIKSLCLTSAWKESIYIYERMVIINDNKVNIAVLNILIAAMCNKDYQTFYTLLGKCEIDILQMFPKHFSTMVYELWKKGVIPLDCCFELLKFDGLCLTKDQMLQVMEFFDREGGKQYTIQSQKEIVDRARGVCRGCGQKLPGSYIGQSQFQALVDNLVETAYGTRHVYKNTTPEELKKFRSFLDTEKPFDFVVDGLNVYHQRHLPGLKQLLTSLKKLKPGARILVIKKHYVLKNKRDRETSRVLAMASFYDIEQRSADDLFLLLAAFQSGPNTRVVSDDNFRDHKAKLDTRLQFVFKRWQSYRQILYTDNSRNGNLQMPACYDSLTVETEDGWHVPYEYVQGQADFINSHLFMCIKKCNWTPSKDLLLIREAKQAVIQDSKQAETLKEAVTD